MLIQAGCCMFTYSVLMIINLTTTFPRVSLYNSENSSTTCLICGLYNVQGQRQSFEKAMCLSCGIIHFKSFNLERHLRKTMYTFCFTFFSQLCETNSSLHFSISSFFVQKQLMQRILARLLRFHAVVITDAL